MSNLRDALDEGPVLRSELRTFSNDAQIKGFSSLFSDYEALEVSTVFSYYNGIRGLNLTVTNADKIQKIRFAKGDVLDFVDELNEHPLVEFAEPNYIYKASLVPTDAFFDDQWYLENTGQNGGTVDVDIDATDAWDITVGDSSVIIAVIDSGADLDHPDLMNKYLRDGGQNIIGFDYANDDSIPEDDNGHGTHVSGIVGAEMNNNIGVVGACPACLIMPIKSLDSEGSGFVSDIIEGMNFALSNGADVINLSLGGGQASQSLQTVVDTAENQGVVITAAAGNDNVDTVFYPAGYDTVISVASSDRDDEKSSFSNYGSSINITAPGSAISSTYLNGGYAIINGTSMAAPVVAGSVGLLMSNNPSLSPLAIRDLLYNNSDDIYITNPSFTGELGAGRLNIYNALLADGAPTATPSNTTVPPTATSTDTSVPQVTATFTMTMIPSATPTLTPVNTNTPTISPTFTNTPSGFDIMHIVINEVNYHGTFETEDPDWIEIQNAGVTAVDIRNWWVCHRDTCRSIENLTLLSDNESYIIENQSEYFVFEAWEEFGDVGDISLFINENTTDAENIASYVQWGSSEDFGRAALAEQVGMWPQIEEDVYLFFPTYPEGRTLSRDESTLRIPRDETSYFAGLPTQGEQNIIFPLPTTTSTITNTFTPTSTITQTFSETPVISHTPSNTAIPSATDTPSVSLTPSNTLSPTITNTFTPSFTATPVNELCKCGFIITDELTIIRSSATYCGLQVCSYTGVTLQCDYGGWVEVSPMCAPKTATPTPITPSATPTHTFTPTATPNDTCPCETILDNNFDPVENALCGAQVCNFYNDSYVCDETGWKKVSIGRCEIEPTPTPKVIEDRQSVVQVLGPQEGETWNPGRFHRIVYDNDVEELIPGEKFISIITLTHGFTEIYSKRTYSREGRNDFYLYLSRNVPAGEYTITIEIIGSDGLIGVEYIPITVSSIPWIWTFF